MAVVLVAHTKCSTNDAFLNICSFLANFWHGLSRVTLHIHTPMLPHGITRSVKAHIVQSKSTCVHTYPRTGLCVDLAASSQAGFLAAVSDSFGALVQGSGGREREVFYFSMPSTALLMHIFPSPLSQPHMHTHTAHKTASLCFSLLLLTQLSSSSSASPVDRCWKKLVVSHKCLEQCSPNTHTHTHIVTLRVK